MKKKCQDIRKYKPWLNILITFQTFLHFCNFSELNMKIEKTDSYFLSDP